jgi:hypothetical protein
LSKSTHKFTAEKVAKNWASLGIFEKSPKVSNHPMGEKSANLVTLKEV